jgi:methyl-accepting chemotaxis protein/CHASE3 domain sensor protein
LHLSLKLKTKLTLGFALMIALTAVVGGLSYMNMSSISNISQLNDRSFRTVQYVQEARLYQNKYIITDDASYINQVHDSITNADASITDMQVMTNDASARTTMTTTQANIGKFKETFDAYVQTNDAELAVFADMTNIGQGFTQQLNQVISNAAGTSADAQAKTVEQSIMTMRVAYLNFRLFQTEQKWSAVQTAITDVQDGLNTLSVASVGNAQLSAAVKTLTDSVNSYEQKAIQSHQYIIELSQKETQMVEYAKAAQGSTDQKDQYYGGAMVIDAFGTDLQNSVIASSNMMTFAFIGSSAVVGIVVAFFIIRAMTNPIKAIIADVQTFASGNLGHKMQAVACNDEVGQIAGAVKTMVHSFRDIVVNARQASEQVTSLSQHVGSTAQQVNAGMEQVSTATQQISQGAQRLSKLTEETAKNSNNLSQILQRTGESTEKSVNIGIESVETMNKLQQEGQKASDSIDQIQSSMQNTAQTVQDMHTSLEKIGELANMVTDVASQTEMLALNAAIEAARAGEAGRGFAVVADAVKELSDQSSQAASETLQSVTQVQNKGKEAMDVAQKSSVQASSGAEIIKASIEGTKTVATSMEKINNSLTDIAEGVKNGVLSVEAVVKAVDEVSSIAEETASAVEENSAAIEEQSSAMNQLAANATQLSEIATALQKELDKFKL